MPSTISRTLAPSRCAQRAAPASLAFALVALCAPYTLASAQSSPLADLAQSLRNDAPRATAGPTQPATLTPSVPAKLDPVERNAGLLFPDFIVETPAPAAPAHGGTETSAPAPAGLDPLKDAATTNLPAVEATDRSRRDRLISPHLRDTSAGVQRSGHVHRRSQAGELSGVLQDACPRTERGWSDPDRESERCCGVDTSRYALLREDHSFKTCCVRREEEQLSEEEIACRHPDGTGWAGLFEFFYPTEVVGWGAATGESLLLDPELRAGCAADSAAAAETEGGAAHTRNDAIVRINVALLDPRYREQVARDMCLHPQQFMKLLDPDPAENAFQLPPEGRGVAGLQMLRTAPVFAPFCRYGAILAQDAQESAKLGNFDADFYAGVGGTPENATDLARGYDRGGARPGGVCGVAEAAKATPAVGTLRGVVEGVDPARAAEARAAQVGHSCRILSDGTRVPLSPVVRRGRAGAPEEAQSHAMAAVIAAGVYAPALADPAARRSVFPRFEPREYYAFTGRPFSGAQGENEQRIECRTVAGDTLSDGAARADRWQELDLGTHGRYATPLRIFAACPKGWVRWRGKGSEGVCGEEKLW